MVKHNEKNGFVAKKKREIIMKPKEKIKKKKEKTINVLVVLTLVLLAIFVLINWKITQDKIEQFCDATEYQTTKLCYQPVAPAGASTFCLCGCGDMTGWHCSKWWELVVYE